MAVAAGMYWLSERFMTSIAPESAVTLACIYLLTLFFCALMVALDSRRVLRSRMEAVRRAESVPLSPGWLVPYILSQRKYARVFAAASAAYGLFYAVLTSMIVYQPGVNFVAAYGATFPSASIAACCGSPAYVPVVRVFLANHLALLVIPLTAVLLVAVAVLVGLNAALAAFAYDSRARGAGGRWLGGLGAIIGLFTGCPTCAGLFFANFLGGSGAVAFATVIGYYQPVFILFSLPILAACPYLVSRSLGKAFTDGCVLVRPATMGG